MPIAKIQGPMLQTNLVRYGVDFAVETDLLYFDTANNRIGIGTSTPSQQLTVVGVSSLDNLSITGDTIISNTTNNDINLIPNGTGFVVSARQKVSNLLQDRVVFINSATGELTTSADLGFDGTTFTATLATLGSIGFATDTISKSGPINIEATSSRVSINSATIEDLTEDRVVFAGTGGNLIDDANFTFVPGTGALSITGSIVVDDITLDGSTVTSTASALTLTSPDVSQLSVKDAVNMPTGSTVQRPSTPAAGDTRFNTDTLALEYYDGTQWVVAGTDFQAISADSFSGDDVTTLFTLSEAAANNSNLIISINGVVQAPGVSYSVAGDQLTFVSAPATGDEVDVRNITRSYSFDFISDSLGTTKIEVASGNVVVTTPGVLDASAAERVRFPTYTVAQTLALSAPVSGDTVFVSDATPDPTLAVYDGSNWKALTVTGNLA